MPLGAWLSCRETNLLGAVASKGLFHDSTGLVHRGFFNLINAAPDNAELTYPMKVIYDSSGCVTDCLQQSYVGLPGYGSGVRALHKRTTAGSTLTDHMH